MRLVSKNPTGVAELNVTVPLIVPPTGLLVYDAAVNVALPVTVPMLAVELLNVALPLTVPALPPVPENVQFCPAVVKTQLLALADQARLVSENPTGVAELNVTVPLIVPPTGLPVYDAAVNVALPVTVPPCMCALPVKVAFPVIWPPAMELPLNVTLPFIVAPVTTVLEPLSVRLPVTGPLTLPLVSTQTVITLLSAPRVTPPTFPFNPVDVYVVVTTPSTAVNRGNVASPSTRPEFLALLLNVALPLTTLFASFTELLLNVALPLTLVPLPLFSALMLNVALPLIMPPFSFLESPLNVALPLTVPME